jgi:hypothetical protein
MKSTLSRFASVLLPCLLFLSGQVFAGVTYYSVPGPGLWLATGTWSNVSPCGASTGGGQVPNATDTLIICNGSTVSVGAVSVGLSATVKTGGKLDLVTNVLTLTGALTNDGGIIDGVGAQAFVAGSIVHNGGTTDLRGVTTNSANIITVNAPGLKLPTGLIGINGLFTSNVDFDMPGSVASLIGGIAVTGETLTLTADNNVTGNIVIDSDASIVGTYPHTGETVQLTSPTLPAGIPTPCISTNHFIILPTGVYYCAANNPISAPIFSIKERARVFIEEVK